MDAEVLFNDETGLKKAGREIIILTLLTAYTDRFGLFMHVYDLVLSIKKLYPDVEFFYLEYLEQHSWGQAPGYDLRFSKVPLGELKRLCMAYEFDSKGRRIADIDMFTYVKDGRLAKVPRRLINTSLVKTGP